MRIKRAQTSFGFCLRCRYKESNKRGISAILILRLSDQKFSISLLLLLSGCLFFFVFVLLQYAKASGNSTWLQQWYPTINKALSFLQAFYDPEVQVCVRVYAIGCMCVCACVCGWCVCMLLLCVCECMCERLYAVCMNVHVCMCLCM